MSLKFCL